MNLSELVYITLICTICQTMAAERSERLPQVDGWSLSSEMRDTAYTPDELRNVIGGAADRFLSCGFLDLSTGTYANASGMEIRAELYRLSSAENAFGIYSQERHPADHFIDIGTQGFLVEKALKFFHGNFYISISSQRGGPEGDSAMVTIARHLSAYLHQEPLWPATLDFFPDEGRISNSETFVIHNPLGSDVSRSAYTCRFDDNELVFIIPCDSAAQARRVAESYVRALHVSSAVPAAGMMDVTDPVIGPIALLLHGNFLCGAIGAPDRERSHWRLSLLRTKLVDLARAAKRIILPTRWKFTTGDDDRYSTVDYDDSGWNSIRVGAYWDTQGYAGYDGVGWYRTRKAIPSALRKATPFGDALVLCLGKVDDRDSVFFNGVNIGHTNVVGVVRKYLVPFDVVRWDGVNTIAVRVVDTGGGGGMNAGPYYLKPAGAPDLVRIHPEERPTEEDSASLELLTRHIRFELLRPLKLSGSLDVRIVNLNTQVILSDSVVHCSIDTAADSSWSFPLRLSGPGSYRAQYVFVPDSSDDTVRQSALIAHWALPRKEMRLTGPVVPPPVHNKTISIPYEEIRLSGYLEKRMLSNLNLRLLNIDESGILAGYVQRPGNQEWVNEYVGKYLSAASRVWRYTRSPALKSQMDRMVDVLIACQMEDGYLGTYLPEDYWLSWDVWGHKYNLIGLLSYYRATGFTPALEASKRIGDLLCRTFGKEDGKQDIVSSGTWFGLASCSVLDPMVDLYSFTGDPKYLAFCNYIIEAYEQPNRLRIVSTLLSNGKINSIGRGKAYELLSNLLGLIKLYRIQGDAKLLNAAQAAWNAVAGTRLYITGSASSHELFQEDHVLPGGVDANICEGCVTTEWLHFNEELFFLTRDARYMDAIETTIYNHLLAAESPLTGCVSYYTPLQGTKLFRCAVDGNCCLASVPRGIAVIPELVYTRNADNGLSINIYSPGSTRCSIRSASGREIPLRCEIRTRFPASGKVRITVDPDRSARFIMALRVPQWCRRFEATVSGTTYRGRAGSYLIILRRWEKNSIIEVNCELTTHVLGGGESYRNSLAVKRGPQVLALDAELNTDLAPLDSVRISDRHVYVQPQRGKLPADWAGNQAYGVRGKNSRGKPVTFTLVPFADAGQNGGFVRVWLDRE